MRAFLFVLLFSVKALACGPWGCYSNVCLQYGNTSTEMQDVDICAPANVHHLDPNNWTEINAYRLAEELLNFEPDTTDSADPAETDSSTPMETVDDPEFQKGVEAFRATQYEYAVDHFKKVTGKNADTALYYIGRSWLRASQRVYDGYDKGKIEKKQAEDARDAFRSFIKKYKKHDWYASAKGLVRRSEVLAQDWPGYVQDWGEQVDAELLKMPRDAHAVSVLLGETSFFDLKALTSLTHLHPVLWLIRSYYVTREYPPTETTMGGKTKITPTFDAATELKALEADSASFKRYKDLYAWSRAVLLLKLDRAQEGYDGLQKLAVAKTNKGSLSWLVLNARLLMKLKRFTEARALIEPYIKAHPLQTVPHQPIQNPSDDFASYYVGPNWNDRWDGRNGSEVDARNFYAMTFYWEGKSAEIASRQTLDLVTLPALARVFVQGATPEEMAAKIDSDLDPGVRKVVEPFALAKMLANQKWELARDTKFTTDKRFKPLQKAAGLLAADPHSAQGNGEIGIFLANIEAGFGIYAPCTQHELTPPVSPYTLLVNSLDAYKASSAKSPFEAKVLKTTLSCFKQSNNRPHCGGDAGPYTDKVPRDYRSQWYRRLKKRFPTSPEAKSMTVYW